MDYHLHSDPSSPHLDAINSTKLTLNKIMEFINHRIELKRDLLNKEAAKMISGPQQAIFHSTLIDIENFKKNMVNVITAAKIIEEKVEHLVNGTINYNHESNLGNPLIFSAIHFNQRITERSDPIMPIEEFNEVIPHPPHPAHPSCTVNDNHRTKKNTRTNNSRVHIDDHQDNMNMKSLLELNILPQDARAFVLGENKDDLDIVRRSIIEWLLSRLETLKTMNTGYPEYLYVKQFYRVLLKTFPALLLNFKSVKEAEKYWRNRIANYKSWRKHKSKESTGLMQNRMAGANASHPDGGILEDGAAPDYSNISIDLSLDGLSSESQSFILGLSETVTVKMKSDIYAWLGHKLDVLNANFSGFLPKPLANRFWHKVISEYPAMMMRFDDITKAAQFWRYRVRTKRNQMKKNRQTIANNSIHFPFTMLDQQMHT